MTMQHNSADSNEAPNVKHEKRRSRDRVAPIHHLADFQTKHIGLLISLASITGRLLCAASQKT